MTVPHHWHASRYPPTQPMDDGKLPKASALNQTNSLHDRHPLVQQDPNFYSNATGCAPNSYEVDVEPVDQVLISSAFPPDSEQLPPDPDLILYSRDYVHFCVHESILREKGAFCHLIPSTGGDCENTPIIRLGDSSNIVNIILHAIYERSLDAFCPTLDEVIMAVDRMPAYGIQPQAIITRSNPLYVFTLSISPIYPLQVYAFAARHKIESLTVDCSSHLLSFPLDSISDDVAALMGPLYLKRLFELHRRRQRELRELILRPSRPHAPSRRCDFTKQREVDKAWTVAAACLVADGRADVSNNKLHETFKTVLSHTNCRLCRDSVTDRIQRIIEEWSSSKTTI